MNKQHVIIAAAALCLGYSAASLAQSSTGGAMGKPGATGVSVTPKTPDQICKGLTGTALDACMKQAADDLKRTQGNSENAASRAGGATPGSGADSASRSVAPGEAKTGSDTSTGGTPGAGAAGKATGSTSY